MIGGAQNIFPQGREPNIVYNWVDLVNATGYVEYDGIGYIDSTGNHYGLMLSSMVDELTKDGILYLVGQSHWQGNTSYAKQHDLDFDLTQNQIPQTIKGTGYFRLNWILEGGGGIGYGYIVMRVRKWDGATETEIASTQGQEYTAEPGVTEKLSDLLKITIPGTIIKKGEQLRITVEVWGKGNDSGNIYKCAFYFDPQDLDVLGTGSRFQMALPFKIEV